MVQKITATALKRELTAKTKKQLIDDISVLFKKFEVVKDYYMVSLTPDDVSVLNRYKKIVTTEFIPSIEYENPPLRLSKARKAISDFRKISTNKTDSMDIMLTYVESGNECARLYGSLYEAFYSSMESMFGSALKYMAKEDLIKTNAHRIEEIIRKADDGWGFKDSLEGIYSGYQNVIVE